MKRSAFSALALLGLACSNTAPGTNESNFDEGSLTETSSLESALLNCSTTELGPHPVRNLCVLGWVGPFGEAGGVGSSATPVAADSNVSFTGATPAFGETQIVYAVDLPGTGGQGAVKFTPTDTQDYVIAVDEAVSFGVQNAGVAVPAAFVDDVAASCTDEGNALPGPLQGTQMKSASVYALQGGTTYTIVFAAGAVDQFRLTIDEPSDFMNAYYPDTDTDGRGDYGRAPLLSECAPPLSHAVEAGDCDDGNGQVGFPGSFEVGDPIETGECIVEVTIPSAAPENCQGTSVVTGVVTSVTPPIDIPATTDPTVTLDLSPGTHSIEWTATDAGGVRTETQTITIDDVTPPQFDESSRPERVVLRCDFSESTLTFPVPTATDNCDDVTPVGAVSASSNPAVPVGTALTVPPGSSTASINLPLGTYTITWTATDSSGNSATLSQVVKVRPVLQATQSLSVRNEQSGIIGDIVNSGTGVASFENRTLLGGDIISKGSVNIGLRATLGHVWSQTNIIWNRSAPLADRPIIASETIAPVSLPAAYDLTGITFPTVPGNVYVNSGQTTVINPGNFAAYTVNSGGTLSLQAGTYFFESLTINASGRVIATPSTVIYIKTTATFQGPFTTGSALVPVYIGYRGNTLTLSNDFNGTVVAPNATVRMGTANAMNFRGMMHARIIDVANRSRLTCVVPN